jgi:ribosomal-protein-alanine N-acetyltransferase
MQFVEQLTVRPAIQGDIDAVLRLDRLIDELPHWSLTDYRAAVAGAAVEPLRCMFVAESGARIAGLAVGKVTCVAGDCTGELETVGVAAEARRRGAGRSLCQAVIAWCRANGASQLELEVRSRSEGAKALYTALGFKTVGIRPRYYSSPVDDATLMRLDLCESAGQPAPQRSTGVDL